MLFNCLKNTLFLAVLLFFSCGSQTKDKNVADPNDIVLHDTVSLKDIPRKENSKRVMLTGADQPEIFTTFITTKKVGIVANQTSRIYHKQPKAATKEEPDGVHLVDYLAKAGYNIQKVFAPEHGFRGTADAGETVKDGTDEKTGIPIISLYGKNKKPSQEQLKDIEIILFDIQDVGTRFYTYISTLHYVMEACAEANIPLVILDRPNPNGHFIDGPILELEHSSFVGMHAVPVVHGMTIGEYAKMINGEGWLKNKMQCDLTIVPLLNYRRSMEYSLPVKPSPNLPNDVAISLYPSLCFFEGTIVSAGRGTDMQFQIFGAPSLPSEFFPFTFTPQSNEGAKYPKFIGQQCNGLDLRSSERRNKINLEWLIEAYVGYGKKSDFFNSFFTKLAGTEKLQKQIEMGYTYPEIRATWLRDLETFDKMRQKYLLYD